LPDVILEVSRTAFIAFQAVKAAELFPNEDAVAVIAKTPAKLASISVMLKRLTGVAR
jgi:hypothetical protein